MPSKQMRLFLMIFVAVVLGLIAIYILFFRSDYRPLFEDIRESDAAAIVAELEEEGFPYQLEDGGRTILVPREELSAARLVIAGSGLAMGSVVGFELFNESDMGLTEFAQKINYLRAQQGELARTIMTMDDISYARVHIALPERTLFRRSDSVPTAAVTIHTLTGAGISRAQVLGIQHLVAASIPELPPENVILLDHLGRQISPVMQATDDIEQPKSERAALEDYFEAVAADAVKDLIPDQPFDIDISDRDAVESTTALSTTDSTDASGRSLRVTLWTADELDPQIQSDIEATLSQRLQTNFSEDDALVFSVRPFDRSTRDTAETTWADDEEFVVTPGGTRAARNDYWGLIAIPVLAIMLLSSIWIYRRRSAMSREEHRQFAELLKDRLDHAGEPVSG